MIKMRPVLLLLSLFTGLIQAQNNNALNNMPPQINNPLANQAVNTDQQMAMNTAMLMVVPQQAQLNGVQQAQVLVNPNQQKQLVVQANNNPPEQNIAIGSNRSYTPYALSGYSSKHHFRKAKINLHKIHILRKFRNECPLFKTGTYKKLFTSKKRRITRCFNF
ncbi:MAG: hypothetical protein BWY70_00547 [Bacteroidetes bacterium ADurb.Bin408]|nr:MAG: hypothetical protein BWY70_00547 [Bacteroidetes bacterium ADurb.Bin408]